MATATTLQTEDLGKQFEMAVCLALGCDWVGAPYKYGLEIPTALKPRVEKLLAGAAGFQHTAEKGNPHDFTSADKSSFLSCKTTKKGGKVAPQQIGQPSCEKFCSFLEHPFTDQAELKAFIQENTALVLKKMFEHLFYDACPVLYYNQATDKMMFITLVSVPDWDACEFSWTRPAASWTNSSTLKVGKGPKKLSLVEIQFHTTRKNMANRFLFENLLALFPECFAIAESGSAECSVRITPA